MAESNTDRVRFYMLDLDRFLVARDVVPCRLALQAAN